MDKEKEKRTAECRVCKGVFVKKSKAQIYCSVACRRTEQQPKIDWTNAAVKKLNPRNRRYYVLDAGCAGFRIYVDVNGTVTFYLQRYIRGQGNARNKLGNFPEMSVAAARDLALNYKSKSVLGEDPTLLQKEKEESNLKFGEVVEDYIKNRMLKKVKKKAGGLRDNNIWRAEIYRAWFLGKAKDVKLQKFWDDNKDRLNLASKKLSEIGEDNLTDFFECATERGGYGANRLIATVRRLFNWVIGRNKFSGPNPVKIIKKENILWNEEEIDHLDYYSTADMKKIIASCYKFAKNFKFRVACYAILAALLCGGRAKSEVFNLTWNQIKWDKKHIRYEKGSTKTGGGIRPITDSMVALLRKIQNERLNKDTKSPFYYPPTDDRHDYIFPNWMFGKNKMTKRGIRKCKLMHVHEVKVMWNKIKKDAEVESRDLKSLRHTFATFCVTKGVSLRMIQKYLMHKSIKTTEVYAAASDELTNESNKRLTASFDSLAA